MKEKLLYKIENESLDKDLIKLYIDEFGTTNLINSLDNCSKERKKDIYRIVLDFYPYIYNLFTKLEKEKDKCIFYELIADEKEKIPYKLFLKLKDPKKYLEKKYIEDIISSVPNDIIISNFKDYFKNEILEFSVGFELLKIKDILDSNTIKRIYKRVDKYDDYLTICTYLDINDLKEFCKLYISLNKNDINIAYNLILSGLYNSDEDLNYLINIIRFSAPPNLIYSLLLSTNLEDKYKEDLEKALIKSNDKEYITYYYFYKDRNRFILMYGSIIAFLAFVALNEEKFKNKVILNDIINSIKLEEIDFSKKIEKGMVKVIKK